MYKIGQLAQLAGISNDTLRYYEKHQLIQPSLRSPSNYRLYGSDALQRIQFILRAKQVGFSLADIKELLALEVEKDQHSCEEVKTLVAHKLDTVQQKIDELLSIQAALNKLHDACCGGPESASNCSILQALENGLTADKRQEQMA